MIDQSTISEVLSRVNIIDIVSARYDIKKAGKNHHACCPFHDEKTPSFTVCEQKQFYYCFGCGANGNAIGFMMAFERMEFPEAVKFLAAQCGVNVEDSDHKQEMPRQLLEQYELDKLIILIYKSDKEAGKRITLEDSRRHRLAVARVDAINEKYNKTDQ